MENKYNFYAYVHGVKTQVLDFVSIGVWEDVNEGTLYPAGKLTSLERTFRAMKRPSPFNFYWKPYKDNKVNQSNFFRTLPKNFLMTIELRIQLLDEKDNHYNTLFWNFYDVGVIRYRTRRGKERVETSFKKFDTGSNQP